MLTIRLQRTGKKNQADFRIVLAEKESPVQKKFVEILGSYNPRRKTFQVKEDRVKYWVGQNIEMSETIHNLFITKGFVTGKKVKAFSIPKKAEEKSAEGGSASAGKEAAPAAAVETPKEVAEATAEMEAKVEQAAPAAEAPKEEAPTA